MTRVWCRLTLGRAHSMVKLSESTAGCSNLIMGLLYCLHYVFYNPVVHKKGLVFGAH